MSGYTPSGTVIGECYDCCFCPVAAAETEVRSVTLNKGGFLNNDYDNRRYHALSLTGSVTVCSAPSNCTTSTYSGGRIYDPIAGIYSGTILLDGAPWWGNSNVSGGSYPNSVMSAAAPGCTTMGSTQISSTAGGPPACNDWTVSGSITATVSAEYTTPEMLADAASMLSEKPWEYGLQAERTIDEDGLSCTLRELRYRISAAIPHGIGSGTCFSVTWIERFIPKAGTGVSSIEVVRPGIFAPVITISPAGGAAVEPVMSASGAVSSVVVHTPGNCIPSATIYGFSGGSGAALVVDSLNPANGQIAEFTLSPGSGYTSAPTIVFSVADIAGETASATLQVDTTPDSPTFGQVVGITWISRGDYRPRLTFSTGCTGVTDSTATATATINADGEITGVTITNPGDYLPTVTFGSPILGGTTAEATCTMSPEGGIAVSLTNPGSGYTQQPSIDFFDTPINVSSAVLIVHIGQETARTWTWDGLEVPSLFGGSRGVSPWYYVPVPEEEGTTSVGDVISTCTGCT